MKKLRRIFQSLRGGKPYQFISHTIETESVSLLQIIKYFFSYWKVIVYAGLFFAIFGVYMASRRPPITYTSTSVVIPEGGTPPKMAESNGLEELLEGQLPVIQTGENVGIESFPGLIDNVPFRMELLKSELYSENYGRYISLGEYIGAIDNSTFFGRLKSRLQSLSSQLFENFEPSENEASNESNQINNIPVDTLNTISENELGLIGALSSFIKVEGSGFITIKTIMPEPKVSTRLNNLVFQNLVEEITKLKTAKQQRNIKLIKSQLDTAKTNFIQSQAELAEFRDANKGSKSAKVESTLERLNSDYQLYFNVYSGLANEYEMAKIELIKQTPFYDVSEPAYVPNRPDQEASFSISIVIRYVIIGFVMGVVLIFAFTGFLILLLFKEKFNQTQV